MPRFGERLGRAMAATGPLCVGIDPHPSILQHWGLSDDPTGLREFSRLLLAALVGQVAAIKPQVAFFERHGSRGMAVLEDIVGESAEKGLLCIMDAKRGDIGSTMAGYADAFLVEGGPFAGDALTVSPFLGVESLTQTVQTARDNRRGVFLLGLTSNPEGAQVQHARTEQGETVAARVAAFAAVANSGATPMGDVGLVIGATTAAAAPEVGIDMVSMNGPILAPGVGAQGGKAEGVLRTFGPAMPQVLVPVSRQILKEGPDPAAITAAVADLSTRLGS